MVYEPADMTFHLFPQFNKADIIYLIFLKHLNTQFILCQLSRPTGGSSLSKDSQNAPCRPLLRVETEAFPNQLRLSSTAQVKHVTCELLSMWRSSSSTPQALSEAEPTARSQVRAGTQEGKSLSLGTISGWFINLCTDLCITELLL